MSSVTTSTIVCGDVQPSAAAGLNTRTRGSPGLRLAAELQVSHCGGGELARRAQLQVLLADAAVIRLDELAGRHRDLRAAGPACQAGDGIDQVLPCSGNRSWHVRASW